MCDLSFLRKQESKSLSRQLPCRHTPTLFVWFIAVTQPCQHSKESNRPNHALYMDCITHIFALTFILEERSLLKLLEPQRTTDGTTISHGGAIVFSLTPIVYDLGAKYNNPLKCVHLFWFEYKDSFLWPILGFLLGCLMTYIIAKKPWKNQKIPNSSNSEMFLWCSIINVP